MPRHGVGDASLPAAAGPACPRCPLRARPFRRGSGARRSQDASEASRPPPPSVRRSPELVTLHLWMSLVLVALCGFTRMCRNPSRDRPPGSLGLLRSAPRRAQPPCPQPPAPYPQKEAKRPAGSENREHALSAWGASRRGRGPSLARLRPCPLRPRGLRRWPWWVAGSRAVSRLGVK